MWTVGAPDGVFRLHRDAQQDPATGLVRAICAIRTDEMPRLSA